MSELNQWFYVQGRFFNRFLSRQEEGLLGPFPDYDAASSAGYEKNMTQIEVLTFPTSDLSKATKMWKARKVTSGQAWDESVQKIRHAGQDIGVNSQDEISGENYTPNLLE